MWQARGIRPLLVVVLVLCLGGCTEFFPSAGSRGSAQSPGPEAQPAAPAPQPQLAQQVQNLETRVQQLERQVKDLEARRPVAGSPPAPRAK
jgi:outer membrane murein-binding lipoprotein Lpp